MGVFLFLWVSVLVGGEDYRSEALRHTHQNVCTLSVMASKRRSATSQMKPVKGYAAGGRKPSSKGKAPATKKEKLLGAELGKTGRAAERGKPVTNAQKGLGNYSRQTMQNKRMRDMPVKRKLEAYGVGLVVGAAFNPNTFSRVSNALTRRQVTVHGSPTQNIKNIEPRGGSNAAPSEKVTYGWNPGAKGSKDFVAQNAQTYAGGSGSIYVAKAKKGSTVYDPGFNKAITKSSKPMKVVKEIRVQGKTQGQIREELSSAVQRAGRPLRGSGRSAQTAQPKKPPTRRF